MPETYYRVRDPVSGREARTSDPAIAETFSAIGYRVTASTTRTPGAVVSGEGVTVIGL